MGAPARALHPAGTTHAQPAEIWSSFADDWCTGFEVASVDTDARGTRYWLRRTSDGWVLPEPFDADRVRLA